MKRRSLLHAILGAPAARVAASGDELPPRDAALQERLAAVLAAHGWHGLVAARRLAVAMLDLSGGGPARYAGANDRQTFYAASLAKIGVMLGVFDAVRRGALRYTRAVEAALERTIRLSSNDDASRLIQTVGYGPIARVLGDYGLHDPAQEGGLWVGKDYGGAGVSRGQAFWRTEPVSGQWHAANCLQVARFFWLMERGQLVSAPFSAEMKRILGHPGTREFFVEGLGAIGVPAGSMFRKYGAWGDISCDAMLVEQSGKRYVAVAWVQGVSGGAVLPKLIRAMHGLAGPS